MNNTSGFERFQRSTWVVRVRRFVRSHHWSPITDAVANKLRDQGWPYATHRARIRAACLHPEPLWPASRPMSLWMLAPR